MLVHSEECGTQVGRLLRWGTCGVIKMACSVDSAFPVVPLSNYDSSIVQSPRCKSVGTSSLSPHAGHGGRCGTGVALFIFGDNYIFALLQGLRVCTDLLGLPAASTCIMVLAGALLRGLSRVVARSGSQRALLGVAQFPAGSLRRGAARPESRDLQRPSPCTLPAMNGCCCSCHMCRGAAYGSPAAAALATTAARRTAVAGGMPMGPCFLLGCFLFGCC